jgi:hypothetical protein
LPGYFGFGAGSQQVFEDCPHGGFCAFIGAPADGLVILRESIEVNEAVDAVEKRRGGFTNVVVVPGK